MAYPKTPVTTRLIIFFITCFFVTAIDAAYFPPTRRMPLNEVFDSSVQAVTYPVYLSDAGNYYVELYLNDENGETQSTHTQPVSLSLNIDIARRGRVLKSKRIDVIFSPGSASQTILWARAPLDLPQRRDLEVTLTVNQVDEELTAQYKNMRLQITRKFEFAPIFR